MDGKERGELSVLSSESCQGLTELCVGGWVCVSVCVYVDLGAYQGASQGCTVNY